MGFHVLGGIELEVLGGVRALGGAKARTLLAALLAHRRSVVPSDVLAEVLWGASPPPTARATLQTHLSKLRRAMGDVPGATLTTRPPGYALEVDPQLVDADRFERGLAEARVLARTAPWDAVALIDEALGLWRGPAFAEFADAGWAQGEAARLEELRLVALEERVEARLATGDHAAVIGELEALVRAHPLRERFWGQRMVALHRSGRQAEALRTAQELRRRLGEELGLEPSAALRELEHAVAVDDPALRPPTRLRPDPASAVEPSPPSPQSPQRTPRPGAGAGAGAASGAVPVAATALVGRADELDRLAVLLSSARVVTLVGPGGVGKSRLAFEGARRQATTFAAGVRVVELAPVRDPAAVVAAVARSLGVERRPERSLHESIIEVAGPLQLLLLLDNCEHVIDAAGHLVGELVRWCPDVTILTTTREPIGMPGEVVVPVQPLAVPASAGAPPEEIAASPAVQIFTARAREASPAFALDERTAAAVAEICIHLDGLPLALELAAARMASMSPRQLAERIHERFALLGGGHAHTRRHRTLLDVVQWSYGLLAPPEQVLLARVSVFAGGFDLDAAEQVCAGDEVPPERIASLLAALVDKSLVVATQGEEARYGQLETLREFGAERLQERLDVADVRRAHVRTFVSLAERGAAALDGPEEGDWATRLDRNFDNLRAAVRTALATGDADSALRLSASARELGFRRIRYEVVDWAGAAAALAGAQDHPLRPTVLAVVAYGSFVRGELDRSVELADEAVAVGEQLGVASCGLAERVLSNALLYLGERSRGLAWMDRMVATARDSGQGGRLAHALYMRSVAQTSIGDPLGAAASADEATGVAAGAGSPTARSQAAYAAGIARAATDLDGAAALLEEAASLAGGVGNRWMRAFALTELLALRARRGEVLPALHGYREVVETWYRGGDWANQWLSLRQLAEVLAMLGRDEDAALLFAAVEAAGASTALPRGPWDADELRASVHAVEQRLGPRGATDARRRGAGMRDDAVVAAALAAIARG